MAMVAGVDGCPAGWICIRLNLKTGILSSRIFQTAAMLIGQMPVPRVMMVDIPIGLPAAGSRACDVEARALLGMRRSSVFPAPVRPAIRAGTRQQASTLTQKADGRKVGAQAWGIYGKVRDIDASLAVHPSLKARVHEVHPELSFWRMNGGRARSEMQWSKKTAQGRAERRELIAGNFGAAAFETVRRLYKKSHASDDDIADAFAALWTARRKYLGQANVVPAMAPVDETGVADGDLVLSRPFT